MEEKSKKNAGIDIDFGLGKINLNGISEGIEKLLELAGRMNELGSNISEMREVKHDDVKKGVNAVFGISIKTGIGGEDNPIVESFGNVKTGPEGPEVQEEREPLTDLFDEGDRITVIMEMPGVSKDDIVINVKEDMLEVVVEKGRKRYRKEMLLAVKVDERDYSNKYVNGVLEVILKKK